jgi:hypothetical protein
MRAIHLIAYGIHRTALSAMSRDSEEEMMNMRTTSHEQGVRKRVP